VGAVRRCWGANSAVDYAYDPGIGLHILVAHQHAEVGQRDGAEPADSHVGLTVLGIIGIKIRGVVHAGRAEASGRFDKCLGFGGASAEDLVVVDDRGKFRAFAGCEDSQIVWRGGRAVRAPLLDRSLTPVFGLPYRARMLKTPRTHPSPV